MDEIRQLPYSIEAEQAVIGAVLINPACFVEVMGVLEAEDFFQPVHKDIFTVIMTMQATSQLVDFVTILAEMKKQGMYKDQESRNYITTLMSTTPATPNILTYAEVVKEFSLKRQLLLTMSEVSTMVGEPGSESLEIIEVAEARLFALRKNQHTNSMQPIQSVLPPVLANIMELYQLGGKLPGLATGFSTLDEYIGGMMENNFIVVASRPGVGKTSLALNIALYTARNSQKNVVFFSLEMSREQLAMRLLSGAALVKNEMLMRGNLSDKDIGRLSESSASLGLLPLYFDDNAAISVPEMKAKCRRIDNLGLVIIDYLQLMHGTPGKRYDNRTTEVGDISRSIKVMAKELGVPVLCLAQLGRESVKGKREPILSDLRESGSIEQDADIVLLLDKKESEEEDNIIILKIAKNRHGRLAKISYAFDGEFTQFRQIDTRYDEDE
jgi:replicative DNA helicase